MKVLLTGATGFIGSSVRELLKERDVPTLLMIRSDQSLALYPNEESVIYNIEKTGELPSEFKEVSHVIHLAWALLDDFSANEHQTLVCRAHLAFLKKVVELGIQHLLVAGTCAEYGTLAGELSESMPCQPTLSYAKGKLWLLRQLQKLQQEHSFELTWGRIFYVYGLNPRRTTLFNLLEQAVLKGETHFELKTGRQQLDFLPVKTLARYLIELVLLPQGQGVLNLCSGRSQSVRQVAQAFADENKYPLTLTESAQMQSLPEPTWGNAEALRRALLRDKK